GEPGSALFDNAVLGSQIEQVAFAGDALTVNDVKLRDLEGGCEFIFHHFDFGAVSYGLIALFDGHFAPNFHADTRIELEGASTGRRFVAAKHDADFFANLVDKHDAGVGARHDAGEFPHRLRHQPCLQPHV